MKKQIRKWMIRIFATTLLIAGIVLIIILNPPLTYASKTTYNSYSIYHNKALNPAFTSKLEQATFLLKSSEFYGNELILDICLNDGSIYPTLIKKLQGPAFARGFYNKVILHGTMNCTANYLELNGYKWNLVQLLVHEMTHCLQYKKLGFWKSNPVANIPTWKWEGYAEYIARQDQNQNQKDLLLNINRLQTADKSKWEVVFEDGTIAPKDYYNSWNLVKYCLDIKKMSYEQLLQDKTSESELKTQMMKWYEENKSERTTKAFTLMGA
ncbi:MAG TPA: hypothetical protein PLG91_00695 [Ferruginibacter sp.]|nr:hypothetical protein [Chitinophagales bacterium]HMX78794.1 hypothetical protein [Ferruginibacter sp.]HNA14852.1 hypothetical protein [Cyclobacteriaceae bacterium]